MDLYQGYGTFGLDEVEGFGIVLSGVLCVAIVVRFMFISCNWYNGIECILHKMNVLTKINGLLGCFTVFNL